MKTVLAVVLFLCSPAFGQRTFDQTITVGGRGGSDCVPFSQSYVGRVYLQGIPAENFRGPTTINSLKFYFRGGKDSEGSIVSFNGYLGTSTHKGTIESIFKSFGGTFKLEREKSEKKEKEREEERGKEKGEEKEKESGGRSITVLIPGSFTYFPNHDNLVMQIVVKEPTTWNGGCVEGLDPSTWKTYQQLDSPSGGAGILIFRDGAGLRIKLN